MKKQNRVAFFNFLSIILLRGISIFTAPLFSRILGTGAYGVVSIYTIWVGVVAIVFPMQVHGTLPTARVEFPEEKQDAYHSAIMTLAMLIFGAISLVVLLLINPISRAMQLDRILIPLILFQAFCNFCIQFINSKFVYEYRADYNCFISVTVAVLTLVLSLVFILNMPEDLGHYGRILAMVVTYGIVGLSACFYILHRGKTFFNLEYWKFCLPLAVPMVFYNLSDLILGQSDRVMLQQMLDESTVGQYSLALSFGMIMFTIFMALNKCWCPFFFDDMKYGRRENVDRQAKNFLELFTVLSMGFVLLHREVYQVFASRDFWPGMVCIPIFVTGYYFNFLCTFPVNYEYYKKKTKAVAIVTLGASAINIGLNYVLILKFGILGAAIATTLSHGLQLTAHYVYARFFLGRGDYPFRLHQWAGPGALYLGILALTVLTPGLWLLRWGLGAALGIWELLRIKKRGSLF